MTCTSKLKRTQGWRQPPGPPLMGCPRGRGRSLLGAAFRGPQSVQESRAAAFTQCRLEPDALRLPGLSSPWGTEGQAPRQTSAQGLPLERGLKGGMEDTPPRPQEGSFRWKRS